MKNKTRLLLRSFLERYWISPFIFVRCLFKGFVEIVWGIAGMFLLMGLTKSYGQETPRFILEVIQVIITKAGFLMIMFAVILFWFELLELRKITAKQKII